jgi:succinate dehydrogenase / fumarate reductase flavoprotein subunit/L-aspartate oxidase
MDLIIEDNVCRGIVAMEILTGKIYTIRAKAVMFATGGYGRAYKITSNAHANTGDGVAIAYNAGVPLMDMEFVQYHPTGLVYPAHLSGKLVTEGVRAAGALLVNALGQRFVDELAPRDVVSAAILRECREGRGIRIDRKTKERFGVWLDTPRLEQAQPGLLEQQFPKLLARTRGSGIDPRREPLLVHPTLHYQNGGAIIDVNGTTTVPGLYAVGEVAGGIHGRNRIMGNALLEIIGFGRRAGAAAAALRDRGPKKVTLEHVNRLRRALTLAGLPMNRKAPQVLPNYAGAPWNR